MKARTCANGSTQRVYTPKEEAASPTALTESILLTATIEAKEGRDVMTANIPNAFIQTDFKTKSKEKIFIKIKWALVEMLVALAQETYAKFVVYEGATKVLYVEELKAKCGMLQAALLFFIRSYEGILKSSDLSLIRTNHAWPTELLMENSIQLHGTSTI